jgi:hypothetical protein
MFLFRFWNKHFLNLQYDYFSIYLYTAPNAMDDFIVNNEM